MYIYSLTFPVWYKYHTAALQKSRFALQKMSKKHHASLYKKCQKTSCFALQKMSKKFWLCYTCFFESVTFFRTQFFCKESAEAFRFLLSGIVKRLSVSLFTSRLLNNDAKVQSNCDSVFFGFTSHARITRLHVRTQNFERQRYKKNPIYANIYGKFFQKNSFCTQKRLFCI